MPRSRLLRTVFAGCILIIFVVSTAVVAQMAYASPTAQTSTFGGFSAAISHDVGRSPRVLLRADVTGDNTPDLITHRWGQSAIVVLPGTPRGEFLAAKVSLLPTDVLSIAAGDLNGDGSLDIVTTNRDRNTIGIALNDGTGTFRQAQTLNAGYGPYGISLADVNNDSFDDIVVANFYGASVSVYVSTGKLDYRSPTIYPVGNTPFDFTIGDIDADGRLDIAAANSGTDTISILRGNSDGTFKVAVNYTVGLNPRHVAIGDLDKDGDLDLVSSNTGGNSVTILHSDGLGSFDKGVTIAGRAGANYTVIRDVNNDSRPDLIVANGNDDSISVMFAQSNGTFQSDRSYSVGRNPTWLVVEDLNGDGLIDLAAPSFFSGTVSVLLGKAPPAPTATPSPVPTKTTSPTATPEPPGEPPIIRQFEINGGALTTGSLNVTLKIEADDPDTGTSSLQMRFSNDGKQWNDWQVLRQSASWKLSDGDGVKTVYAQVRDNRNNRSTVATDAIALDARAGDAYSVTINNGARFTKSTQVELTITAKPGTAAMQVSSDGSFEGAVWEPYTPRKAWQVDRYKNKVITRIVYVRFRTTDDVTLPVSDDILLDVNAPRGKVTVPKPAVGSSSQQYQLFIEASDDESGVADMRLSNSSAIDEAPWEEFTPARLWQSNGSGYVYLQLRDNAGNVSDVVVTRFSEQKTYIPLVRD